jgi:hypothetical protein
MNGTSRILVILFGKGGLSDVGRHALQAALEQPGVECRVLTQHPDMLKSVNWACGCPGDHHFTPQDERRFQVFPVDSWLDDNLLEHFQGATAVVSCLGNRQPFLGGWISHAGNKLVIKGMTKHNVERAVILSSAGIEEDWPPFEFHWAGKIMRVLLRVAYFASRDLTLMEREYRASDKDFLFVRPTGLGEDVIPVGKWFLQHEKYKDQVGMDMAKLDCARFMVQEALTPTRHRSAVVVGSEPPPSAETGQEAGS